MAKARAIVRRRKSVRNIRKITKTMQMIATAKFQKSLKRAVATKPYTLKVRDLVRELASHVGDVKHPLLRRPTDEDRTNRIALIVITSNRGLAGAYNGGVLRAANRFIHEQTAAGKTIDLYVSGKKGVAFFNYQKRPLKQRYDQFADLPRAADVNQVAQHFIDEFTGGTVDSVHVAYMNFISAATQRPEVLTLLPLAGVAEVTQLLGRQAAESTAGAEHAAGVAAPGEPGYQDAAHPSEAEARAASTTPTDARRQETLRQRQQSPARHEAQMLTPLHTEVQYEFSPDAQTLLDELLPLTVKTALFQCFMDAVTSENVARMVAMKSATDNADKMIKSLTMQYNRARQSQITTELSEIMGGVEAMKS